MKNYSSWSYFNEQICRVGHGPIRAKSALAGSDAGIESNSKSALERPDMRLHSQVNERPVTSQQLKKKKGILNSEST